MRLVVRFTAALMASIVAVLTVFGVVSVARQTEFGRAESMRDHELMAGLLQESIAAVWETEGQEAALRLLDEVNERKAEIRMAWEPGGESDSIVQRIISTDDETDRLITRIPVAVHGEVVGQLVLDESLARDAAFIESRVLRLLLTGAAMGGVAGLVAFLLGRRMVGIPVRRLVSRAQAIGRGELVRTRAREPNDELGDLARALDEMAGQLAELRDEAARQTDARIAALAQLRHAERLNTVGKLAAGLAHELGTPLNVISARATMLTDDARDSDVPRQAQSINEQVERMTSIIRRILDFARRRPADRQPRALAVVAHDVVEMLQPLARQRRIQLALSHGDPVLVDIDAAQIQQVISNILVNAMHASPEGSSIEIELGVAVHEFEPANEPRLCARLIVRDHGTGIAPEHRDHIFEPFFTTKDVGAGTGLGLAVAYGIVTDHEGCIEVGSTPGGGTTITVVLPLAKHDHPA